MPRCAWRTPEPKACAHQEAGAWPRPGCGTRSPTGTSAPTGSTRSRCCALLNLIWRGRASCSWGAAACCSQMLAEVNAAVDNLESHGLVRCLGFGVVNQRVGGHFTAAVSPRPALRGTHQRAADSLAAMFVAHEPAFYVTDLPPRVAAVGVGTQSHLQEADHGSAFVFGNQPCDREVGLAPCGGSGFEFAEVLLIRTVGPKQRAQDREFVPIFGIGKPDVDQAAPPTPKRWRACPLLQATTLARRRGSGNR